MPRLLSNSKRVYTAGFFLSGVLLSGFLLAGLIILITSARGTAWAKDAAQSIVIEDAFGRKISVDLPVQRIVVLNSDILEVLRSLGAQDLVKGIYSEITKEGAFFQEFMDRPRVGSWKNANAELIADLNPSIVIAYENNPGTELEKQLSPFGIQVLRLNFYKLGTIAKEIRTLSKIIGREQQGEILGAWYGQKLDFIQKRLDKVKEKPLVYVESYSAFHTAGPGSGGHDMCVYAGGKNMAEEFKVPYSEVTSEWVISKQPDVIFKSTAWGNGFERNDRMFFNNIRDEIAARPSWNLIQAVKNGRVHVLDSGIWTGPRAVIGVIYMAKCIYPRLFDDLDPEQIHELEGYAKEHRYQLICYPALKGKFLEDEVKAIVIKKAWQRYELNFRVARFGRGNLFSGVFIPLDLKQNIGFHISRGRFYQRFISLFQRHLFIVKNKFSGLALAVNTNTKSLIQNPILEIVSSKTFDKLFDLYPNSKIRLAEELYETKAGLPPCTHVLAISAVGVTVFKPDEIETLFDFAEKMLEGLENYGVIN